MQEENSMSQMPSPKIDMERFMATIDRSAGIGVGREGGLSRLALTDADKQMRDLFVQWCRDADLSVSIDATGSIFAHRSGLDDNLPPVLIGSHLDTQANGGRFDGIVGVLGGLEVVRALNEAGHTTKRPLRIVNWTNEEGARFSPPMLASSCFAGVCTTEWAHARRADDGPTFGEELARIGYLGSDMPGNWAVDSYFELHIEQGSVLFEEKAEVGVVTHGYVSHGLLIDFAGETAHTGPWPMEKRRNALVAAARFLVAVDDIGWRRAATGGKSTAARLVAWPNKPGILSDWAQVVCDVRHEEQAIADQMLEEAMAAFAVVQKETQCSGKIIDRWNWGGRIFDEGMIGIVREAVGALGYRARELPSQAGHDAYLMATVCPTAMIFTPCRDGITHNNKEFASREDLAPGLTVLLESVLRRANRP
jgi:N-carbamoyl-L-amino-acid hydrolase